MLFNFLYMSSTKLVLWVFMFLFCWMLISSFEKQRFLMPIGLKKSIINKLQVIPREKSQFFVPLCHLMVILLVRSVLEGDVQLLESETSNGLQEKTL